MVNKTDEIRDGDKDGHGVEGRKDMGRVGRVDGLADGWEKKCLNE